MDSTDLQIARLFVATCLRLAWLAVGLFLVRSGTSTLLREPLRGSLSPSAWLARNWLEALIGLALFVTGLVLILGRSHDL